MQKKRWGDLSPIQKVCIIIGATIQFGLLAAGLWDLAHRTPDEVRGDRRFWAGFMFVNWIGPIAYFCLRAQELPHAVMLLPDARTDTGRGGRGRLTASPPSEPGEDRRLMALALDEARRAGEQGEVPIGAVLAHRRRGRGGPGQRARAPARPHRSRRDAGPPRRRGHRRRVAAVRGHSLRDPRAVRHVRGSHRPGSHQAPGLRSRRPQGGRGRKHLQHRRPPGAQSPAGGPDGPDGERGLASCCASSSPHGGDRRDRQRLDGRRHSRQRGAVPPDAPRDVRDPCGPRHAPDRQPRAQPAHHAAAGGRRHPGEQPRPALRRGAQPERRRRPGPESVGGPPGPAARHPPPHLRLQAGGDPGGHVQLRGAGRHLGLHHRGGGRAGYCRRSPSKGSSWSASPPPASSSTGSPPCCSAPTAATSTCGAPSCTSWATRSPAWGSCSAASSSI